MDDHAVKLVSVSWLELLRERPKLASGRNIAQEQKLISSSSVSSYVKRRAKQEFALTTAPTSSGMSS